MRPRTLASAPSLTLSLALLSACSSVVTTPDAATDAGPDAADVPTIGPADASDAATDAPDAASDAPDAASDAADDALDAASDAATDATDAASDAPTYPAQPLDVPHPGAASTACHAQTLAMTAFRNDLNRDLGDYGIFFEEARTAACADAVAAALLAKVRATLATNPHTEALGRSVGPYQGWLEGVDVALIFATAAELGGQGRLTGELDAELVRVRDSYVSNPTEYGKDPGCGFDNGAWRGGNNCMDDFSIAASAYGWMAGYEAMRGRDASALVGAANRAVSRSLLDPASVCIYDPGAPMDPAGRGPCNGTVAALRAGTAQVASLNHGFQNIGYGLGLMTSVSNALLGLEAAGARYVPGADETDVAMGLFDEAQRKSLTDGSRFKTNCFHFVLDADNTVGWTNDADCGDAGLQYRPTMFPVRDFYLRYFRAPADTVVDLGAPQPAYGFDLFDPTLFSDSPEVFYNPARRSVYGDAGQKFYLAPPPLSGTLSDAPPAGEFEGYDPEGCAVGWACDPDAPGLPLRVDFYARGWQLAFSAAADQPGDATVAARCGGTGAHRFRACPPPELAGALTYAFALDATRGAASLPAPHCPDNPGCRAPGAPPAPPGPDAREPIGYLDAIDPDGCARGWACDPDDPAASVRVDLFADDFADSGRRVATGTADLSSEAAVRDLCGGGDAHRFRVCLPPEARGHYVYAFGIDTVDGAAALSPLTCPEAPACIGR